MAELKKIVGRGRSKVVRHGNSFYLNMTHDAESFNLVVGDLLNMTIFDQLNEYNIEMRLQRFANSVGIRITIPELKNKDCYYNFEINSLTKR